MVIKDHYVGYTAAILNVNCKFGKSDIHVVSKDFPESKYLGSMSTQNVFI